MKIAKSAEEMAEKGQRIKCLDIVSLCSGAALLAPCPGGVPLLSPHAGAPQHLQGQVPGPCHRARRGKHSYTIYNRIQLLSYPFNTDWFRHNTY